MKLVDDHFTNQPWWHSCKGKKSMKNWKYICEPSRGFQHFFIRTSISSVGISMSIILISTIIFCELVIINLFPFCVQPAFSIKYFFFSIFSRTSRLGLPIHAFYSFSLSFYSSIAFLLCCSFFSLTICCVFWRLIFTVSSDIRCQTSQHSSLSGIKNASVASSYFVYKSKTIKWGIAFYNSFSASIKANTDFELENL